MLSRIILPCLAAAVLMFACGPKSSGLISSAKIKSRGDTTVATHVSIDTINGQVQFSIAVHNGTRRSVELDFPDGQTHDFVVLDSVGREVWRWSEGRMFTQAMQNRLVGSHDSVVYHETWKSAAPGQDVLLAVLNSENHPVRQKIPFALP